MSHINLPKALSLIVFLIAMKLSAQQTVSPESVGQSSFYTPSTSNICSNDILLHNLRKDPAFKAREEKMNRDILVASRSLTNDTLTLPVVVHIVNENPNAISDLFVKNGIQDLNDAFSKSGAYAASLGVDTKIRFCIAQKDPDGGNTTGITRTKYFFGSHLNMDIEDARLKKLIQWDPSRYINIWLISSINAESYADFSCGNWYRLGVGGYATFPPGGGPYDGIVITGFGVLLAHEMGHYLGLYHTFEGGCFNNDCTLNGDRVCDTPPDNSVRPSPACNNPQNSCGTDTLSNHSNGIFFTDVPDQIVNFMDYGNGGCSIEFTQGQADRMRAAIQTQRAGLLQDECGRPCVEDIVAGFSRDNAYPLPGDLINFTNASTGATNYQWLVDGVIVSTTTNFSYTAPAVGKYKVTLKAFNTIDCFASYTDFITVTCGVTARFYTDKKTIASKLNIYIDSIRFTNTSVNATSYKWIITNPLGLYLEITDSFNLTYVFPTPATYQIRLIATNGTCTDTTGSYSVPVLDPTADGVPFAIRVLCYQQNKVRVDFCLADFGFAPLPQNTPVNFYDADPRTAGAHRLSPTFYLPVFVPGGNCLLCFSHIVDVAYHGIERIWLVFNDAGTSIPVLLPNAVLAEKNYINNYGSSISNRTIIRDTICHGQNHAGYTLAGTYIDTLVSVNNGCDSIRTLHLVVNPVFFTTVNSSICQGQNYAGHTTTGTYVDVYSASNGCDSTRTLNLTVLPTFTTSIAVTICQGQNYYGHTSSGIYVDHYFATNGCDSARTLQLTVLPTYNTFVTATICQGQNYAGHTTSGTYVDHYFAVNGCDSSRTLQLTVNPTYNTTINASICQGQNYAGHVTTGTYIDANSAVNGCDSTRTLFLTVNPVPFTTVTAAICVGDNYAGHTTPGIYIDVYPTVFGCDSTRTLFLTVKPFVFTNVDATICEGTNYAGHVDAGVYVDIYTGVNGCDSVRTLRLFVNPKKFTTINAAICNGERYFAGGHWQNVTGTYFDTLQTFLGCDSIISTHLTVNPLPVPDLGMDRGVCIGDVMVLDPGNFPGYSWHDGSVNPTLTTNTIGQYWVRVTNSFGCEASDTMRLTQIFTLPAGFLPPDSSLCRGNVLQIKVPGYTRYNWSTGSDQNTIAVTQSNTYRLQATDANGCKGVDSMKVFFYPNCIIIEVPNAFTPNGDGRNDVFMPLIPAPVSNYHFQIWNRWGQLLFETQNYQKGWDGTYESKSQGSGVFVYLITFRDVDGKEVKRTGTVVLIR